MTFIVVVGLQDAYEGVIGVERAGLIVPAPLSSASHMTVEPLKLFMYC